MTMMVYLFSYLSSLISSVSYSFLDAGLLPMQASLFLDILFFVCVCSVTQLCPALCGPMNYSLPGSSVHEIFQERILEWAAISQEKAVAPHSSTLAWKIPWVEEPGRLQSMGSLRVRHDRVTSLSFFTFMHWRRKWQPTPVFLPGESQRWGSLVDCCLWCPTELDKTEVTQQQQPYHTPGDLYDPGIKVVCLMTLELAGGFFISSAT